MNSMNSRLVAAILNQKRWKERQLYGFFSQFRNSKQTIPEISNEYLSIILFLEISGACKMNVCRFYFGLRVFMLIALVSTNTTFLFSNACVRWYAIPFNPHIAYVIVANSRNCFCIRSPHSSFNFYWKEFYISKLQFILISNEICRRQYCWC